MPYMYSEMQNKLSKIRDSPLESMGQIISSRCPIGHLGVMAAIFEPWRPYWPVTSFTLKGRLYYFYRRHHELVSKFNVRLKSLLHQGLSEPEFYGDLVYKIEKIMGRTNFSYQFQKIMIRHKRIGYDLNVMRQSAC